MRNGWIALGLLAALAACDGEQPLQFGEGPSTPAPTPVDPTDPNAPPPTTAVPTEVAGNLRSSAYTPPSGGSPGSLTVTIYALDSPDVTATYTRRPSLDVPGYTAYAVQDDPLDRLFVGYGARVPDGTAQGVLVVSGGQFNRYFGGVDYERLGAYSQPTTGLVSYAGDYVGMVNGGYRDSPELLPDDPSTPDAFEPLEPARVTGQIFLNVAWADSAINGSMVNRQLSAPLEDGSPVRLDDLALVVTDIGTSGTFSGVVEPDGEIGSSIGRYTGLFGGTNGTSLVGGIRLEGDFSPDLEAEEEYGLFVLVQCGLAGDSSLCGSSNP